RRRIESETLKRAMRWRFAPCFANLSRRRSIMRTLRVAAVSMNGFLGEPERVLNNIAGWCERAAAEKAELVLFPELVIHGHCTPNTWELAEPVPDGPSVRRLAQLARHYRLILRAGPSEEERDRLYNAQVLVGPDAYLV